MSIRILVIDDDPLICELLTYQLSGAGYQVRSYQNSAQALLQFAQDQPDLVLLDVMMPGASGWDVCRQIRAAFDVPVIMLTAKQADDDVVTGLNCGADDYVGKPFTEQQLLARIAAVLRRAGQTAPRPATVAPRSAAPTHVQRLVRSDPPPAAQPARSAPVPRLGPALTEARQRRNLSLHDAERLCNVRWEFLQALEQEQFRYLPRETLRKALREYSALLGVDLQPYLRGGARPPRRDIGSAYLAISALLALMILLGVAALIF